MSILQLGIMLIMMLAMLCGSNYYLARRVYQWVRYFCPKFSIWIPAGLFAALTVMMFLSVARPFGGTLQSIVSGIGTFWMGIFVYLLLLFLMADLMVWVVKLSKLLSPTAIERLRAGALIGATALAILICVYGVIHATQLYTVKYDVQLSEHPTSQMNIVMLSDVHLGAVGSEARLEKIVSGINKLQPDLVCIAGDFFDSDFDAITDPEKAIETLKQIQSKYGVYACFGNHDAGATFSRMEEFLAQANIRVLKDEYTVIDGRLILAGRLDISPIGEQSDGPRKALSAVLAGADPNLPVVMMDHNPASADTYQGEADLILSGHTHKGQIFPASLITNAMYTVDYGYYQAEDGTQVIVTSGVGTWGLPMRVGTNCEIVNIHLTY